jgi:hypothetical protein
MEFGKVRSYEKILEERNGRNFTDSGQTEVLP